MSTLLDAIAAERAGLLAPIAERLAVLDEIERLATRLVGESAAPSQAEPEEPPEEPPTPSAAKSVLARRTRSSGVGRDGLSQRSQNVLEVLRAERGKWMTVAAIGDAADFDLAKHFKGNVDPLIERGLVEKKESWPREYRAVTSDVDGVAGASPQMKAPRAAAPPAAPQGQQAGLSALSGTEAKVLRARILDHLSRRGLSEQSLASQLNAEREHIADICGKLLLTDAVVLEPDGHYRLAS